MFQANLHREAYKPKRERRILTIVSTKICELLVCSLLNDSLIDPYVFQVCCLSRLPLFGYIEVKLNIIVDKIFEHGNFDCDELLKESYNELNRCLTLRMKRCPDDSTFISSSSDYINDFYIETCLRELIIL